jgi:hypothetical protein
MSTEVVDRGDEILTQEPEQEEVIQEQAPEVEQEQEQEQEEKKELSIPKARFDEAVRKERSEKEEYARRLKEYEEKEAQRNVAVDYAEAQKHVKELIKQHTNLLADGELEKAADLMEQILEMKELVAEHKAEAKAMTAKDQAREEIKYDALVAKLEADYPQINPEAEEFDKATVRKVQAMMSGLMQTERMTPSQALKEATETILGAVKAPAANTTETGIRRKEAAVTKAMSAKSKQPPSTNSVGLDHDKEGGALDSSAIMKMSFDEFVKLPDSKLSELRGDFV